MKVALEEMERIEDRARRLLETKNLTGDDRARLDYLLSLTKTRVLNNEDLTFYDNLLTDLEERR